MIDIRLIRKDRQRVEKQLQTKDPSIQLESLVALETTLERAKPKLKTSRHNAMSSRKRLER